GSGRPRPSARLRPQDRRGVARRHPAQSPCHLCLSRRGCGMKRPQRPLDPRGKTLPQLLVERAGLDGDTLALRQKALGIWQTLSWRDVHDQVAWLSDGLAELGLRRGETAAIIGENEPEHFFAEYAAQACGAVSVSMYPDLTGEEMHYILAHCGAVVLF